MKPADVCLAVLVAVIWGFGFVASRLALDELSPALMTTLRFAIAAVPCLFVRRPEVSWRLLIAISVTLFLGQFLAQSWAIAQGVPVGLASVIVQSQALFTVAFAALAFGEIPTPHADRRDRRCRDRPVDDLRHRRFRFQRRRVRGADDLADHVSRSAICCCGGPMGVPMFDLFAWLCLVPPLPLLALTLLTDGPQATWHSLAQMSPTGLISMLFIGAISTCVAYWLWGRLLRDYTAAQVVPFALLVPFVGAAASSVDLRRAVRPVAAGRHGHRGLRHRHHAAVEAAASLVEASLVEASLARIA